MPINPGFREQGGRLGAGGPEEVVRNTGGKERALEIFEL